MVIRVIITYVLFIVMMEDDCVYLGPRDPLPLKRVCRVIRPLQEIRLAQGLCTRINTIIRKHPLCLGTHLHPFITYTIAGYIVSLQPSFIAMHAIQYW